MPKVGNTEVQKWINFRINLTVKIRFHTFPFIFFLRKILIFLRFCFNNFSRYTSWMAPYKNLILILMLNWASWRYFIFIWYRRFNFYSSRIHWRWSCNICNILFNKIFVSICNFCLGCHWSWFFLKCIRLY